MWTDYRFLRMSPWKVYFYRWPCYLDGLHTFLCLFAGIQADTMAAVTVFRTYRSIILLQAVRASVESTSLFLLGDLLQITRLIVDHGPRARSQCQKCQKCCSFHSVASKTWCFLWQVLWFCTGFCFTCKPCPRCSSAHVAECWIRFSWLALSAVLKAAW